MIAKTADLYRNAFSGLTKRVWLLSVVMLINRSGSMVVAFMTLYCNNLGYTMKQGGFVVAIYGIGSIVGAFLGGRISDKFGFYYTQFSALFFGGLSLLLLGQMRSYEAICITTFFASMINESFRPANSSAIAFYSSPENRTQSFSLVRLSINLGFAIGAALGGFLAVRNYHLLFWVDGCTNIAASFLLLLILPKVSKAEQQKPVGDSTINGLDRKPYQDRIFLYFLGFQIIFAACFFQIFTTIPLYFKKVLLLPESTYGGIMAATGIIIVLFEMILVYTLEKKKIHLLLMTFGSVLMAVSYLILNLTVLNSLIIAIASMLIITFAEMISMPFMNSFYTVRATAKTRGQYAGLYTMSWSIAQVLGSFGGSSFAENYGFFNLWFFITFLSMLAAGGYYWLRFQKD